MLQLETARGGAQRTLSQPHQVSLRADSLKRRRAAAFVHHSEKAEDRFLAAANTPAAALATLPERSVDAILDLEMARLGFVLERWSGRWQRPTTLRRGNFFS